MLHHGKASDTPPVFDWKGDNYFVHMYSDLDFLVDELKARGVPAPPEFTKSNPLLMNSNQRLGRVCAAQSIILEMVEMTKVNRPISTNRSKASRSVREESPRVPSVPNKKALGEGGEFDSFSTKDQFGEEEAPHTPPARNVGGESALDLVHHSKSISRIYCGDEEMREGYINSVSPSTEEIHRVRAVKNDTLEADQAPADGKINSNFALDAPYHEARAHDLNLQPDSSYQDDTSNDFQEYTGNPTSQDIILVQGGVEEILNEIDQNDIDHSENDQRHGAMRNPPARASSIESWDARRDENSVSELHVVTWQDELAKAQVPATNIAALCSCLDPDCWNMVSVLQALRTIRSCFATNAIGIICQVEVNLRIVSNSVVECVDAAIGPVLTSLRRFVDNQPNAAAEIDIDDILDALQSAVSHPAPNELIAVALEVGQYLCATTPTMFARVLSPKACEMFHYLYPFIMTAPRKSISNSCRQVVDSVASIANFETHPFFLDYIGKGMVLLASAASNPATNTSNLVKLSIVCDRADPVTSSMKHVDYANGWSGLFELYPFFSCVYGEKIVNQTRVEAGEGRGPLKEWFSLLSHDFSTTWTRSNAPVTSDLNLKICNRTVSAPMLVHACGVAPSHRLDVQPSDGGPLSCRVIRVLDNDSVLVDQVLSTTDMFVDCANYTWYTPHVPLLVYIQESETYFLNEMTDRAMVKHLECYGWLLAMAIYHQTTLECRVNVVLFELLLGADLTIDKIEMLDKSLYNSWMQLSVLDNFQSFLEVEELPPTMTPTEYIAHALKEKSTKLMWQVDAIKCGLARLIPVSALHKCMMSPQDFQRLVYGDPPAEYTLRSTFVVSMDKELEDNKCFHDAFWEVIDGMASTDQRKFVKFVTGIDKLPSPGTEFLRIEVPFTAIGNSERQKQLLLLPQSHTCDNILELPNYWAALRAARNGTDPPYEELVALLRQKLLYAIENGSDYGLDATGSFGDLGRAMPESNETREASTDSLQLPSLLDDAPEIPELSAGLTTTEDNIEGPADMPVKLPTNATTIEFDAKAPSFHDASMLAKVALSTTDDIPATEQHDDDEYSFDDFEEPA
ncbi:hypothetical protein DYB32_000545 [Aphanomyces invadans]|uniref:HECT-type E3 ubiquitin transferase n=1 Tax=Aphanomyces invadans TaxID=157072 RepID=A0A418B9M8_9STRA|nr:hypothetical protein DYB32_000545 [Aphanomyces invadans]